MHTAPATNASSANVLSPGPSSSVQVAGRGTPNSTTAFKDVYRNVAANEDGRTEGQPSGTNVPVKKKISDQENASAVAVPVTTNSAAPANAILTLSASLALTLHSTEQNQKTSSQSDGSNAASPSPQPASPADLAALTSGTPGRTDLASVVESAGAGNLSEAVQKLVEKAAAQAPAASNPPETAIQSQLHLADNMTALPGASQVGSAPQTLSSSSQILAVGDTSSGTSQAPPTQDTLPLRSLPIDNSNLAFTLQLSKSADNRTTAVPPADSNQPGSPVHTPADSSATVSSQPATAALTQASALSEPLPSSSPAIAGASPSRTLPNITPASPNQPRIQASADSATRQQHDSEKSGSSQRESSESSKQDTTERAQAAANTQESPGAPVNELSSMLHQPPASITTWLDGTTQAGTRPMLSTADPSPALRTPLAVSIQEIHLAAEAPKTTGTNEILLQVGSGPNAAALRIADRAGTVNVSVHAADQDLRTSLRANLTDLTAQLNAQGLKTESVKTTASQSSSDSRSDQQPQDQRSGGQQHSSQQGERQSPRDRRTSALWLDELQEQTANAANPGGNKS